MPSLRSLLLVLFFCVLTPIFVGATAGWATVALFGQDRIAGGFVAGGLPVLCANLALSRVLPLLQRELPLLKPAPLNVRFSCSALTWLLALKAYVLLCPPV